MADRVPLSTGVPGLDDVLGGGIADDACTVIGGGPGTGKTTLALQTLFANASHERPGLFCTGAGEQPHQLLRHQQQLGLLPCDRTDVHLLDLGQPFAQRDLGRVLEALEREIERRHVGFIVIDLVQALTPPELWTDIARLLGRSDATSLLVVDAVRAEAAPAGLLSVADGVLWLEHTPGGAHSLEALKMRGQRPLPGLHAVRLTSEGVRVFPRWPSPAPRIQRRVPVRRLSLGSEDLDCVLGGGIPAADVVLVDGGAGTGKSVLASQFIAEAGHRGEPGLVVLFEERPDRFITRAEALDLELARLVSGGFVDVVSFRGRDLEPDELIWEVQHAIRRIGAECVVIDSTAGLELALRDRQRVQDCLWRLLDTLSGSGLTVWVNSSPEAAAALTPFVDDVLELRRAERHGRVQHRLSVVKMSGGNHTTDPCAYTIIERGLQLLMHESAEMITPPVNASNGSIGSNGSNGHMAPYTYGNGVALAH